MIRKYREQDLDQLLEAWAAASEIAHPFLPPEFVASERENIPNLYLPNAETWVYVVQEEVVAFIALLGDEVGGLFVHPAHQRNGIGQELVDRAKELRGQLEVDVFEENRIGRAFYKRYGFELIDQKIHEPTGCSVLRLRLSS